MAEAKRRAKSAVFTSIACDIQTGQLFLDESYQRPLQNRHVPIVQAFDEHRFETLAVNERRGARGRFAVIDGQARLAAARELAIPEVPCRVYDGLTPEEEATLFVKLQQGRKNLRPFDRFRAKERAGDRDTIEIHQTVVQAGMDIGPETRPGIIGSVAALERMYRVQGPLVLGRVVRILVAAWGASELAGFAGGILAGLARVLAVSQDDEKIVSKLRRKRPADVFRIAGALADGRVLNSHNPRHVSQAIVTVCELVITQSLDARTRDAWTGERRGRRRHGKAA